jgi:lipopolysaccharide transport system permease protein
MSKELPDSDLRTWSRVIVPRRALLQVPVREIWAYRDLVFLMAVRDLTANYKQTILGPFWFVLQPLMTTAFFTVIFGRMAKLGTDGLPPLLFYFSGITLWSYLAECVNKSSNTFVRNAQIFGKVYFPRMVVPLASALTALATFLVQYSIFCAFLWFYWAKGQPVHPSWRIIFTPFLVAQLAMLGVGMGCIVSALSTRFRDLTMGITFGVQLWMYASSIIFPLSRVAPEDRWMFALNPIVPVVEAFRFAYLGFGIVERWQLILSFGVSAAIFILGVALFNHAEQTAMDSV